MKSHWFNIVCSAGYFFALEVEAGLLVGQIPFEEKKLTGGQCWTRDRG